MRVGNKGDGNKRKQSRIPIELENVTRKLIWSVVSAARQAQERSTIN